MQEEIFESLEQIPPFPQYNSTGTYSNGTFPILVIPKSKYSSTETEDSSCESFYGEHVKKLTSSGCSISNSSIGSSRGRRRRRKRRSKRSSLYSDNSKTISPSLQSQSKENIRTNNVSVENHDDIINHTRRRLPVPKLNAVNDLKHSTGRHRGIAGSNTPVVDTSLFALFYLTDTFDSLLSNGVLLNHQNSSDSVKKSIVAILKNEIIYSLRVNYYCPAGKIAKFVKLLREYYPKVQIQVLPEFLELCFSKILHHPPFLHYANGTDGYILRIPVEPHFKKECQPFLSIQHLLQSIFSCKNIIGSNCGSKFLTVPYPALIVEIQRNCKTSSGSLLVGWEDCQPSEPVIPNLEITLRNVIHNNNDNSFNSSWKSGDITSSFMTSTSASRRFDSSLFLQEDFHEAENVPVRSRLLHGFKSACKLMFGYLEELAVSSPLDVDTTYDTYNVSTSDSKAGINKSNLNLNLSERNDQWPNSFTRPHSQATQYTSSYCTANDNVDNMDAFSTLQDLQMELIAVICLSPNSGNTFESSFSGYSVYCKADVNANAKSDGRYDSESPITPWIMYQSRSGIAPQVTLIENCGKWIHSLERNSENLTLYEIPLEIRRLLQDSKLLIYRQKS